MYGLRRTIGGRSNGELLSELFKLIAESSKAKWRKIAAVVGLIVVVFTLAVLGVALPEWSAVVAGVAGAALGVRKGSRK